MRFEIKLPNGSGGHMYVYYDSKTMRLENADGTLFMYEPPSLVVRVPPKITQYAFAHY